MTPNMIRHPCQKTIIRSFVNTYPGRHDTQRNDIQHNDTQHKWLLCDTQHNSKNGTKYKWHSVQNDKQYNNALSLC
jgi:hypothetical protein